jgi:HK97 family phage portal protein
MNFLQRLKAVFSQTAFEQYVAAWVGGEDLADATGAIGKERALRYSAFWACNRVLAETFASVSIHEYKRQKSGDRERTDDTGLYPILHDAPNDETSRFNFQECLMYQINLGGNFVAERLMDGRRIAGLLQLPYENYEIFRDPADHRLKYRLSGAQAQLVLDRSEVLHIPGPSTDGFVGMSVLSYAASTIRLGSTYDKFGQKFYENGATPSGTFEIPKFLKDEAYTRLKADLGTSYTGLVNAGKPLLLEDGLTYKPLTINPIDAELLSSRKFQVEDICRFFRVQPHLIQHLEKSTNNNIEQQSLEFLMYTMLPHFKRVEDNINSQLLTPRQRASGYYFEYNMASLLRGDQASMATSFSKGIQWGYFSVNDVRRMLNLNSVPNGDTYLQPLNMVPLGTEPEKAKDEVKKLIDQAAKEGKI